MQGFGIKTVPSAVIDADRVRFGNSAMETVIQHSGLELQLDVVRSFCDWFAGKSYDWKETTGGEWREGYGEEWLACLGQHLGQRRGPELRHSTLHMTSKAGAHGKKPYYWTRFIAVDIDNRRPDLGEAVGNVAVTAPWPARAVRVDGASFDPRSHAHVQLEVAGAPTHRAEG
jgi:hypothetical protein